MDTAASDTSVDGSAVAGSRAQNPPTRPAAAKLLRALRRWAAGNGAAELHVNVTTAIDAARTDRMLRKMGFRQTGGNYVLEGIDHP